MVYKSGQIFFPFCHNFTRVTDRQTDGQTEFSSLDRVCIACSAVKTLIKWSGSPRNRLDRREKGLSWKAFLKEPNLKLTMKD